MENHLINLQKTIFHQCCTFGHLRPSPPSLHDTFELFSGYPTHRSDMPPPDSTRPHSAPEIPTLTWTGAQTPGTETTAVLSRPGRERPGRRADPSGHGKHIHLRRSSKSRTAGSGRSVGPGSCGSGLRLHCSTGTLSSHLIKSKRISKGQPQTNTRKPMQPNLRV